MDLEKIKETIKELEEEFKYIGPYEQSSPQYCKQRATEIVIKVICALNGIEKMTFTDGTEIVI